MLLGGHPPTAIHITIGVVIYFLFRQLEYRWTRWFRQACLLVGSMTLGVLLAAAQILPYLDYYRLSSSSSASANQNRWAGHLTPNTLIHFLLPYVSGGPSTGFERLPQSLRLGELDNFNERTGYVGILPLFLVLCAAAYRRCRFTIFYLCVALISLLVIYGVWPLPTIIRSLPILSHINHTRLLLFFCFSAAVLAGLGWDTLLRMRSRRPLFWVAIVFWVAVALALLWFWLLIKPRFQHLDSSHRAFLLGQLLVLAGGVISVGLVLWPVRWGGTVALMVGLAWLAIDLLWFGLGYNPAIPRELYYPRTRAMKWLEKDQSIFRILGGDSVLIPNTAQIFGLSDVRGCDFVSVRRYEELITGTAGNFFFYGEAAVLPEPFRLLNVKYVLLPTSLRLDPNLFELVYADEINIYRHKACCDRALLVFDYQVDPDPASVLARVRSGGFDPQKTLLLEQEPKKTENGTSKIPATNADSRVRIVSYEPDEVRIEASLPRPGFLLLLDTYFPGWSATVNGRKTPIYRADYNFRAVSLPTGRSTICFSYQPWSLRVGAVLSAASLLAIGALWFWPRKE